ncbi:acyltransferase family protein [Nonomuraea sp. NPDC050536]|uniref:acyltransferase family protein n=1 Tax=Nonomuraea sp. NPDC050536 TaxID=3364366 RepID=UPI0037CBC430
MAVLTPQASVPHTAAGARLAWLDALRGIAALAVVYEHALGPLLPEARQAGGPYFAPGWYGVLVFFLVSGYVVPASLERRGDLRGFWISRGFRLYPLWAACMVGVLALSAAGVLQVPSAGPVTSALAHLTMLQDLLGVPRVLNVLWTLSYEMAFYLLLTALFRLGWHRRSLSAALAFTAVAVAGAGLLPTSLFAGNVPLTLAVALALVAAGLAGVLYGGPHARRVAAAALAVTVVVLLACNGHFPAWQSLIILATMFSGTVLYRAERGELTWFSAAWVVLVPFAAWALDASGPTRVATLAAWATFAAGMLLRHRRVPGVLAWLGLVSYSVYLLHPLLLHSVDALLPDTGVALGWRLAILAAALAALLGLSALTWRWVELPGQRLGARLRKRLPPGRD